MKKLLTGICFIALAFMMVMSPLVAVAGDYPEKAIKIVVPYKPGGGSDLSARIFAKYAPKYIGNDVVVTNIDGGGGVVGASFVMSNRPDGYTLLWEHQVLHLGHITGTRKFKWDDYDPVCIPVKAYYGVFAKKDAPFNNVKELVEYVKVNPGKVTIGFAPLANSHCAMLKMIVAAGMNIKDFRQLPMSGDKNRIVAMLQGNINLTAVTSNSAMPYLESGDLKVIGMESEERFPGTDYPTMREQGFDVVESFDYAVYAPKGTDPAIIKHICDAFLQAAKDPELKAEMEKIWIFPILSDTEQTKVKLQKDYDQYKKLVDDFELLKKK